MTSPHLLWAPVFTFAILFSFPLVIRVHPYFLDAGRSKAISDNRTIIFLLFSIYIAFDLPVRKTVGSSLHLLQSPIVGVFDRKMVQDFPSKS